MINKATKEAKEEFLVEFDSYCGAYFAFCSMVELELDGATGCLGWVSLGGKFLPPLGLVPLGCVPLFAMRLVFLCGQKGKTKTKIKEKRKRLGLNRYPWLWK